MERIESARIEAAIKRMGEAVRDTVKNQAFVASERAKLGSLTHAMVFLKLTYRSGVERTTDLDRSGIPYWKLAITYIVLWLCE